MDTRIKKINSPEEDELELKRVELAKLSELLAEKELELASLRNSVIHFEHRYYRQVGIKYVELDEINAKIAQKKYQKKTQKKTAKKESEAARETANNTAKEFHSHEIPKDEELSKDFKPSDEIRKLYRQIAMKIHPDRVTGEKEKEYQTKLMAEVNDAYANGDIERLRQILQECESSPESVKGEGIAVDLVRMIRSISQIKGRLKNIEKEIETLKESEMHKMMIQVQAAEENGRDLLSELADKVDSDIQLAQEKLEGLA